MRTAGLTMNDVWAHRVLREQGVRTHSLADVETEIDVFVDSVDLKHRGSEEKYRPYLHVLGSLRAVRPLAGLPHGISQVDFSPGYGEQVDAFYEFTDEQLQALAAKGYFQPDFVVPDQITGIEWELPARCDVLLLEPAGDGSRPVDQDAPVVFVRVHDLGDLQVDLAGSGHDLVEYFADHSRSEQRQVETMVDEQRLKARSDAIDALFAQEDLLDEEELVHDSGTQQTGEPEAPISGDDFEAQLRRLQEEVEVEQERYLQELAQIEGTPENLYRTQVASRLEEDPGGRDEPEQVFPLDSERTHEDEPVEPPTPSAPVPIRRVEEDEGPAPRAESDDRQPGD